MRQHLSNHQAVQGFTLIELLVAMLIFAMLALAGWQIMDSLSKTQQRAKMQIDQLSQLQYAYLQLSQDFSQVTSYVPVPIGLSTTGNQNGQNLTHLTQTIAPTFTLNEQSLSFIRFASPDPRFNMSPTLTKIQYVSQNNALLKQRSYQLVNQDLTNHSQNGSQNFSQNMSQSVLLTNVKDIKWTAWTATDTPEMVKQFPDNKTIEFVKNRENRYKNKQQNQTNSQNNAQNSFQTQNSAENWQDLTAYQQLPTGVTLSFTYHDEPIVWQFALTPKAPNQLKPMSENVNENNSQNRNENNNPNNANNNVNTNTVQNPNQNN